MTVFWPLLLLLALLPPSIPGVAAAENGAEEEPIFQRFALKRTAPRNEQLLLELPLLLRPQTDPQAEVEMNLGLHYVTAYRPEGRFYFSRSLGFATARWNPSPSDTSEVSVTTADFSILINSIYRSFLVTSFGLGLGVMDGLLVYTDARNFETRLELFSPVHLGLALRLGENWQVGLKLTQSTFFHTNPVVSMTRLLVGVGYNF